MRILLLILVMVCLPAMALAEDYCNPMDLPEQYAPIDTYADPYGIGDPFVMRHNGMYYLYASSCEDRVRVWTSRDLVNWTFEGWCTQGRDVYFAYAPEVVYWRGSFYMITSPSGSGHYILKSDDPLGPFLPVTKNFGYSIDGSFFKMDDGRLMIFFPDSWKIKSSVLDEETMLPSSLKSDTGATLHHWTEGPGLFRRGDWYYRPTREITFAPRATRWPGPAARAGPGACLTPGKNPPCWSTAFLETILRAWAILPASSVLTWIACTSPITIW